MCFEWNCQLMAVQLVAVNNPDKILFVGEALVGNEAVDQLSKFDRALRDFSSSTGTVGKGRGIDGMLVTKWDTVDDKVGFIDATQ
jgi:signal recognition particle receptor subunit alpha